MASFSETFKAARKKLGAGKTFTWNGKKYTTDLASEKSSSLTTSPKPMKRPVKESAPSSPTPKAPKQEYRDAKTLRRKQEKAGPVQGPEQKKTITGPNTAPVKLVKSPYQSKKLVNNPYKK